MNVSFVIVPEHSQMFGSGVGIVPFLSGESLFTSQSPRRIQANKSPDSATLWARSR